MILLPKYFNQLRPFRSPIHHRSRIVFRFPFRTLPIDLGLVFRQECTYMPKRQADPFT